NLLKSMVKESFVPVTVKIRLGWDSVSKAVDIALKLEDSGIDAIFVHGRTQVQGYSGLVDYKQIKNIKDRIKIPLIASGDIFTPKLAKKMFDETGCDGVLVARGALGNPWIFKEIQNFLNTGEISNRPDVEEIKRTIKMHLDLFINFYGEKVGVIKFRKFYIWYSRGFIKVKPLRLEVSGINTKEEMIVLIEQLDRLA
ncbi:MAG: tRNA-dihydrouridine synthase, partial [Candidatus Omnitrophica bacterium]|nr:tRNA-dihydrouridine synthase [Candidatus Omnitrophota bacterium]